MDGLRLACLILGSRSGDITRSVVCSCQASACGLRRCQTIRGYRSRSGHGQATSSTSRLQQATSSLARRSSRSTASRLPAVSSRARAQRLGLRHFASDRPDRPRIGIFPRSARRFLHRSQRRESLRDRPAAAMRLVREVPAKTLLERWILRHRVRVMPLGVHRPLPPTRSSRAG